MKCRPCQQTPDRIHESAVTFSPTQAEFILNRSQGGTGGGWMFNQTFIMFSLSSSFKVFLLVVVWSMIQPWKVSNTAMPDIVAILLSKCCMGIYGRCLMDSIQTRNWTRSWARCAFRYCTPPPPPPPATTATLTATALLLSTGLNAIHWWTVII